MGLFSSRYKHYVGTAIQKVVEDDQVTDPFMLAIVESSMTKVDLVDNLLETAIQSAAIKTNNYYNFVKNNHPSKMPTGEVILDTRFDDAVREVLQAQHSGQSLSYVYTKFGPPNVFHEAWEKLLADYGLDTNTGELVGLAAERTVCKLVQIEIELPNTTRLELLNWQTENWFAQEQPSTLGYIPGFDQVSVSFSSKPVAYLAIASPLVRLVYQEQYTPPPDPPGPNQKIKLPVYTEKSLTFALSRINSDKEFFQTVYNLNGQKKFFTYQYESGGNAILDGVMSRSFPQQKIGQFYPNIYYRRDKTPETDPLYKKMSRRLDMDYDEILTAINENPDIADVDLAAFNLGISADATTEVEISYLFDFFKNVWTKNRNGAWNSQDWLASIDPRPQAGLMRSKNAINITDGSLDSALVYDRVARQMHAGSIGPVGFAVKGTGTETRQSQETNFEGDIITVTSPVKYRYYRKQVATNLWEEIRVFDMTMVYTVFEQHKTTLGDNDDEICLVPLDRSLVRTYPISVQQELVTRSYNFVFNSHVVQKVKWYQTGIFKVIMVVVALVVFINTGYGAEFLVNLTAAAAGGAFALLSFLFNTVLVQVAIQFGFKIFVKLVGPEFAFLVALVAMTMGMLKQNFAGLNAKDLLSLASYTFEGVGNYLQDSFQDLQEEMESFLSLKSDQEKELEQAMDLLSPKVHAMTPIILGESPDQFLYRTTVFGTTGFTQINDVGSYTERSLQLPTTGYSFEML